MPKTLSEGRIRLSTRVTSGSHSGTRKASAGPASNARTRVSAPSNDPLAPVLAPMQEVAESSIDAEGRHDGHTQGSRHPAYPHIVGEPSDTAHSPGALPVQPVDVDRSSSPQTEVLAVDNAQPTVARPTPSSSNKARANLHTGPQGIVAPKASGSLHQAALSSSETSVDPPAGPQDFATSKPSRSIQPLKRRSNLFDAEPFSLKGLPGADVLFRCEYGKKIVDLAGRQDVMGMIGHSAKNLLAGASSFIFTVPTSPSTTSPSQQKRVVKVVKVPRHIPPAAVKSFLQIVHWLVVRPAEESSASLVFKTVLFADWIGGWENPALFMLLCDKWREAARELPVEALAIATNRGLRHELQLAAAFAYTQKPISDEEFALQARIHHLEPEVVVRVERFRVKTKELKNHLLHSFFTDFSWLPVDLTERLRALTCADCYDEAQEVPVSRDGRIVKLSPAQWWPRFRRTPFEIVKEISPCSLVDDSAYQYIHQSAEEICADIVCKRCTVEQIALDGMDFTHALVENLNARMYEEFSSFVFITPGPVADANVEAATA